MDDLELLRTFAPDVTVPAGVEYEARIRLQAAIAADAGQPGLLMAAWRRARRMASRWDLRLTPVAGTGLAVLAVLVAVAMATGVIAPSPATARLNGLAQVAERISPSTIPVGTYLYARSEETTISALPDPAVPGRLATYRVTKTIETWQAEDGSALRRTTTGRPEFLDPEDAALLTPAVAQALGVGEPNEVAFGPGEYVRLLERLPTDPAGLLQALRQEIAKGEQPGVSEEALIFEAVADLFRRPAASPEVRAGLLRVLADLDGIALARPEPGRVAISIVFFRHGTRERQTLIFEEATAALVGETLIEVVPFPAPGMPGEVPLRQVEHRPVEVVDTLG